MLQGQMFESVTVNIPPNSNKAPSPKSSVDFLPVEKHPRGEAAPSLARV